MGTAQTFCESEMAHSSECTYQYAQKALDGADIVRDAIYRQQFTVPLREELNSARFEVIHRACNLDAAGGFEIP